MDVAVTEKPKDEFFNPLDPDVIDDPYSSYARLHAAAPVHWHDGLQSWLVVRYNDCIRALTDGECFSTDFRKIGEPTPPELLSLQTLDPPDQTPLRQLGQDAVRSLDMPGLEERARDRAADLWQRATAAGDFDAIDDLTDPFTLGTITDVLDVEAPPVNEQFAKLNDELDASMDSGVAPEAYDDGLRARAAFNAVAERWLAESQPGSILRLLVDNQRDEDFTHDVLVNSVRAFFHAGFEVPSRFLGNALLALLRQPGGLDALCEAPLERAIEELARYAGPVQALSRACITGTDIGGHIIAKGQVVVALIAAADRDPAQFPAPDELRLTRSPNAHVGFGRGPHSCMGQHIARLEARALLSVIREETRSIEIAGDPVVRRNATLRGLRHLPLRVN